MCVSCSLAGEVASLFIRSLLPAPWLCKLLASCVSGPHSRSCTWSVASVGMSVSLSWSFGGVVTDDVSLPMLIAEGLTERRV